MLKILWNVGSTLLRSGQVLLCSALGTAASASPAWAYIDPTAAGSAAQSLYVLLMGLVVMLSLVPAKLTALFKRILGRLNRNSRTEEHPVRKEGD